LNIPEAYYNQAVKPRGTTVNERLTYLLNWYNTTGTKVAEDSNWSFQIETNRTMAQYSSYLRPLLLRDTDEETRKNVEAFIPIALEMASNSKSAPKISFFTYLYIELQKVVA